MEFTPVGVCAHGNPQDTYCAQCTYMTPEQPQDLIPKRVVLVLDIEAEKHWTDDELNAAVVSYMTSYIDDPTGAWQPTQTYYIKGVYAVDGNV